MKSMILWGLAGTNVLLASLWVGKIAGENAATAQVQARPEYLMIPAELAGVTGDVVFVLDSTNGRLGGFQYDVNNRRLEVMPVLEISRNLEGATEGRRR